MSRLGLTRSRDYLSIPQMKALGRKLFGDRLDLFEKNGMWYVGRFLDDDVHLLPWRRREEIFGCGRDVGELFSFLGPERTWSIPGVAPTVGDRAGVFPHYDRYGRIVAWRTRAGVFYRDFPGAPAIPANLVS